jgi:hypothetical protein
MVGQIPLGRVVLRIVIGAVCVAAAVASYALLGGEFSDTDWKVIGASTLFALASSLAAAGLGVRERSELLGDVTVVAATAAFVLVSFGMWVEVDGEGFWRVTAIVAIVALEAAHVAFVWSRLRPGDPPSVARITHVAMGLAVVSAAMGIAPIADRLERLGAGPQVQAECERLRRLARSASR